MSYHAATTTHAPSGIHLPRGTRGHATQGAADRLRETGPVNGMARAIATYCQAEPMLTAELRADMADRLATLTGRVIAPESIFAEPHTRTAIAAIDHVVFRLREQELVVIRPCAYCATGHFTSPAIEDITDLGFALAEWEPLHDACAPEDPRE
jgi:hypothetical protein